MKVSRSKNSDELKAVVFGKIDTTNSHQFENKIKPYPDGIKTLVLDFSDADYISSAGLRVLLPLQKTMDKQGKMRLMNVNDIDAEIFEVTGFKEILIYEK